MKYYLDTNIVIAFVKGTSINVQNHIRTIPAQSIIIPSVVLAEIEYGAQKSYDYYKTKEKYDAFTKVFQNEPFDSNAALYYGEIRADLEKQGLPIGPNDLMIASIVLAGNGTLITNNEREFKRINGLKIENWTL
ncbi:MAG: type II toxin-antitoxin system VapC family toxin [Lachnospiraceae bacterium]|nr:type II toxin-antitoxin system VapC family toxin [Lachnospiraceae bacterium]